MTLKNIKLSQTRKTLLENPDLWEELADKAGEEISGGAIFSFENRSSLTIDANLLSRSITGNVQPITLGPLLPAAAIPTANTIPDTIAVNIPGNLITVVFDENPSLEVVSTVNERMTSNRIGVFELETTTNTIVFSLE